MKKKIVAVMLVSMMILSLAACGKSSAPASNDNNKTEATAPTKEEKKTKEKKEASGKVEQINLDNSEGSLVYSKHEATTNYDDLPAVRVYFNYTNKSSETKSAQSTFFSQVFQNGVECDITMSGDYENPNAADQNLSKELQSGTTIEVAFMFLLQDATSPVTVKVSDRSEENISKDVYQEQELAMQ